MRHHTRFHEALYHLGYNRSLPPFQSVLTCSPGSSLPPSCWDYRYPSSWTATASPETPFLPLRRLRLQGETRTPRQTPAPQPRAHWRRARQPEPINGRRAGSRARAHRAPRPGRSEARSRPLGPHVTRRRGRAPHPRTKRRGRAPGCEEDPRRGLRRGAHSGWVAPPRCIGCLAS